jgi:acyl-CoA synthetase (AMP-forming)/AMP-acid ligase II
MKDPNQEPGAGRVTFEGVIDRVASSASLQAHVLTDGHLTCPYRDVPDAIGHIDDHFAERGVGVEDCLTLECVNSVPGALTLLYMLKKGYDFVLLPPMRKRREKTGVQLPAPAFCRYEVAIESPSDDRAAARLDHPESFLCIVENGRYRRVRDTEGKREPKLYVRTSGSIGSPKMAVHSHIKLLGNAMNCVEQFELECDDRITIPVPIFHMYGLGAAFLPGIIAGASIDLQENTNILRYMDRERQFDPNVAFLTPTLCEMLLRGRKSARTYRLVVTATDQIRVDTFLAFESRFGRLLNLYGSTELGAIAACGPDDPLDVRSMAAVEPMSGVQVRLKEEHTDLADGTRSGELCFRHSCGFDGYVDENGDAIERRGAVGSDWFETGDLGIIRPDGYIQVLGRCDHSVKRSGLRVLFVDIEKALEMIEGVGRAIVVLGKGDGKWGKRIAAFCVVEGDVALSGAQVRKACFDVLPRHAIPDDVFVVDSFPTLPNGKIDRPALARMAYEGRGG